MKCTPDKLKTIDPFILSWSLENIVKDDEEEFSKVKNILEAIKPWLNFELYKDEQKRLKKDTTVMTSKDTFNDELLKHGATVAEVFPQAEADRLSHLEKEANRIIEE